MNTDAIPQKPRMLYKIVNIILLFLNSSFAFGIFSTYSFETLQIHQKAILIVPAALLTSLMVIKEFKVKPLIRKLFMNTLIFVGFILIIFCWVSLW